MKFKTYSLWVCCVVLWLPACEAALDTRQFEQAELGPCELADVAEQDLSDARRRLQQLVDELEACMRQANGCSDQEYALLAGAIAQYEDTVRRLEWEWSRQIDACLLENTPSPSPSPSPSSSPSPSPSP